MVVTFYLPHLHFGVGVCFGRAKYFLEWEDGLPNGVQGTEADPIVPDCLENIQLHKARQHGFGSRFGTPFNLRIHPDLPGVVGPSCQTSAKALHLSWDISG